MYVCLWLIHVDIWQEPAQYCKAVVLQLKKKCMRVITVDLHYYPSQRQNQERSGACEKRHKEEMGLSKISREKSYQQLSTGRY